jgi:hypothetical protein
MHECGAVEAGEMKIFGENTSQSHIAHHKSHMASPRSSCLTNNLMLDIRVYRYLKRRINIKDAFLNNFV